MADGGMVCQDCHGDMKQVGDDFTEKMAPGSAFPSGITRPSACPGQRARLRLVPHRRRTSNLAKATGAAGQRLRHQRQRDGIRLIRAYLDGDEATTAKRSCRSTSASPRTRCPTPSAKV